MTICQTYYKYLINAEFVGQMKTLNQLFLLQKWSKHDSNLTGIIDSVLSLIWWTQILVISFGELQPRIVTELGEVLKKAAADIIFEFCLPNSIIEALGSPILNSILA